MKRTYGLIGFPLSHSFSGKYFTDKFLLEGTSDKYSYRNFELKELAGFPELLKSNTTLSGLNVTIPYKEKIIPFLDELRDNALAVRAVNTICIRRDETGKVIHTVGYNTDVTGFYSTIKPLLQKHHSGALVLGAGGASKAVIYALKLLNVPSCTVSRNKSEGSIAYTEITKEILEQYPVIINTTPLGSFPDLSSCPEIPYDDLGPMNLLYDLVYNPPETLFLQKGRLQGAQTVNGYAMLVAQAEASWQIWKAFE